MYKLFSSFFLGNFNQQMVDVLTNPEVLEELEDILGNNSVIKLKRFHEGYDGNYENLHKEYRDFFIIPLGKYITPYESVYRDIKQVGGKKVRGLLMGNSALAVKKFYGMAGADLENIKELPDHIGVELEFMRFLCEREYVFRKNNDNENLSFILNIQKKFLHEHLCQWIDVFCNKLLEKSASNFYRGLATLVSCFVKYDYQMLQNAIGDQ